MLRECGTTTKGTDEDYGLPAARWALYHPSTERGSPQWQG